MYITVKIEYTQTKEDRIKKRFYYTLEALSKSADLPGRLACDCNISYPKPTPDGNNANIFILALDSKDGRSNFHSPFKYSDVITSADDIVELSIILYTVFCFDIVLTAHSLRSTLNNYVDPEEWKVCSQGASNIKLTTGEADALDANEINGPEMSLDCVSFGSKFNYEELKIEFTKACPDFATKLSADSKLYSLRFAGEVLFTISPQSRTIKSGQIDKTWKLRFPERRNNALVESVIIISTNKAVRSHALPPPKFEHGRICLTVQQASLLALERFRDVAVESALVNKYMLTPLAAAVFSKQSIEPITEALHPNGYTANECAEVVSSINESALIGGQYLKLSECHIAVLCALSATMSIKDINARTQIIRKTFRQYTAAGKKFSTDKYNIFAKHILKPNEYRPEVLIGMYDEVRAMRNNVSVIPQVAAGLVPGGSGQPPEPPLFGDSQEQDNTTNNQCGPSGSGEC